MGKFQKLVRYNGKMWWWDEVYQELIHVENSAEKIPFVKANLEEVEFLE
jgi:hypothetical protein